MYEIQAQGDQLGSYNSPGKRQQHLGPLYEDGGIRRSENQMFSVE